MFRYLLGDNFIPVICCQSHPSTLAFSYLSLSVRVRPPEKIPGQSLGRSSASEWVLREKPLSIQMKDKSNSCSRVYIPVIMGLWVVSYLFFSNASGGYKMSSIYLTREAETLPHCHGVSGN